MLRVLPKRPVRETQGSGGAPQPAESTADAKHTDNKRKQSPEEQNAKHGVNKFKQLSDEHLDRWIWTAKGSMTWRQFYDKNGR